MKIKAVGLLSGGLDSSLAVKLILEQGIDVQAVKFTSPFCLCDSGGQCHASTVAVRFNVPLKFFKKGEEYFKILRKPKYGYGRNMNPCLDCRIFMFKKTKKYAKEIGAKFIFTGEVLGERPMSQHKRALNIIEKESGLENKILRPLSAKLMPPTEAEKKGWVDRKKLLAISGRSRKPQIILAKKFGLADYPCPSGGCLLTYKEFADKVKDLIGHKKTIKTNDILLLKTGRHFRFGKNKIIVGRNENENKQLLALKEKTDYCFEAPECGSPITLLRGPKTKKAVELAGGLTAYYADSSKNQVLIKYGQALNRQLNISPLQEKEIKKLRI